MLNTYFPLKVHSHYSLSVGLSMPKHITKRCVSSGLAGCVLSDHNSISGAIDFIDSAENRKIKPVIGCEVTVVPDYNNKYNTNNSISLVARNFEGWLSLVKITSESHKHYYNEKPHITLEDIAKHINKDSIFCMSGWLGSEIGNSIFKDPHSCYLANSYENAKTLVNPDWYPRLSSMVSKYKDMFGEQNFFLGIQLCDNAYLPASRLIAEGVRYLARKDGVPTVAVPDSYYSEQADAYDQRVLLVNKLGTNLKMVHKKPVQGENVSLGRFFMGTNYDLPSYEQMVAYGHTPAELEKTVELASQCSSYSLKHKPMLPQFPTPDGSSSKDYMYKLCQLGWEKRKKLIDSVIKSRNFTQEMYTKRFQQEFNVLTDVGLADYFLIVNDILDYAIKEGQIVGAGRGSAAGSLILYLLGVTQIDPMQYDLLFERFYNAGRNTKDNISLPDVDMDFEKHGREKIIMYVRNKYGHERVAQMITFIRMQGRGAVKDVLRAHDAASAEDANRITKNIPDEAEIADLLEIIKEADKRAGGDGDASIIEWSLENEPNEFKEWVFYDDNGKLQGPLSKIFEQAIRMEGTKKGSSKHAAGIVISNSRLSDICPMVYDETTKEMIAGMEMNALGDMGQVKFDFLGIAILDKLHLAMNYLRTGDLSL